MARTSSSGGSAFFRTEEAAIEEERMWNEEKISKSPRGTERREMEISPKRVSITQIARKKTRGGYIGGSISSQMESMKESPSKQKQKREKIANEARDKEVFPNAGKESGTSFIYFPRKEKVKNEIVPFLKKKRKKEFVESQRSISLKGSGLTPEIRPEDGEGRYMALNGSQANVLVPSPTDGVMQNIFFGEGINEDEKRRNLVSFCDERDTMVLEAESQASNMLAMEREAKQMEKDRIRKQDMVAKEFEIKQKRQRERQFSKRKEVKGAKFSLRVGVDDESKNRRGVGSAFAPHVDSIGIVGMSTLEEWGSSGNDCEAPVYNAPGFREMPQRIGISSAQGRRPKKDQRMGRPGTSETTGDGLNWAATNKAPGRPATAGAAFSATRPAVAAVRVPGSSFRISPRQKKQVSASESRNDKLGKGVLVVSANAADNLFLSISVANLDIVPNTFLQQLM